jgi:thiol-disulfide isomerase/thioredoxin
MSMRDNRALTIVSSPSYSLPVVWRSAMLRLIASSALVVVVVCGCTESTAPPVAQAPSGASTSPAGATAPNATPAPASGAATAGSPAASTGAPEAGLRDKAPEALRPGLAPIGGQGKADGKVPSTPVAPSGAPGTPSPAGSNAPAVPPAATGAPATPPATVPTESAAQLIEKAKSQFQRRDIDGGVASVRAAVAAEPTNRMALAMLTDVLQAVGGQASQRGDKNGANAMFIESASFARKLKAAHPDLNDGERQLLANALYNEACAYNLQGQSDKALTSLRESVDAGFSDVKNLDQDSDLASLREKPEYTAIRDEMAKLAVVAAEKALEAAKAEAQELLGKGESFPFDFELTDIEDKSIKLADFKGKVLIVDLWGTWCPPCRMEIPHFIELKNKYGAEGLEIVGLNYERVDAAVVKDTVKKFVDENKMNYRCAVLDQATQQKVPGLNAFPTTLFIDRSGKVRLKVVGYHPLAKLEAIVSMLLAEPAPTEG